MCRVTMGHLRVTVGHLRVTVGHPWVTIGHLRATMGHLRLTIGYLKAIVGHIRVTLGHLKVIIGYFFTELHPKVRQTCILYSSFIVGILSGINPVRVAACRRLYKNERSTKHLQRLVSSPVSCRTLSETGPRAPRRR